MQYAAPQTWAARPGKIRSGQRGVGKADLVVARAVDQGIDARAGRYGYGLSASWP
jgi:hypothetical protein